MQRLLSLRNSQRLLARALGPCSQESGKPTLHFTPKVSTNSFTFGPLPPSTKHTALDPVLSSSTIKHGLDRGSHINRLAWKLTDKRPRFFTISVLLSHLISPNIKLKPIFINNYFPSIYLHVSTIADDESKTRMLVDTSATTNTDNKAYHQ